MIEYQYMVDFTLPEIITDEYKSLIPYQRAMVNQLFEDGKLISYSLSMENQKLWAVFVANSELDVMDILADMPLTPFMKTNISMLTFHNTLEVAPPHFSLN